MIDITKQYTYKNGEPARILCTDRPNFGDLVVLSMRPNGDVLPHLSGGECTFPSTIEFDLVEVWLPKEGELVFCWKEGYKMPNIRYFSHYKDNIYWIKGLSLHSDLFGYTNIAPFTGELPEAFKGL